MDTFLVSALSLAKQVAILFVLMGVGVICTRVKFVDKNGVKTLVNLLLYIVTPFLIVNSFLSVKFSASTIAGFGIAAGCALLSHIIGILFSYSIRDKDRLKRSVYRFGTVFCNGGYMGIPLAQALFGEKGVFYASAYVIVFNIIQWTYGITLFKSDGSSVLKSVFNPGTLGVFIGLPLFLLNISLPDIISQPLMQISSLNTPLAMIVSGYYLAGTDFRHGMGDKKLWTTIAFRMLVVPAVALVIFKYVFLLSGTLLSCCVLSAAAPCAVNTMVFASKFGGDTDKGLRLVTVSTVLSIITMPLLLAFAQI